MAELKTVFVIAITTARMIFPGLPATLGDGDAAGFDRASKSMIIEVMSDTRAHTQSVAEVTVPQGLKIGPKATLKVDLTQPPTESQPPIKADASAVKLMLKSYWGSHKEVPEDQPKVTQITSGLAASGQDSELTDYPRNSYAYWPGFDDKVVGKDSVAPGTYKLTTNYVNGTSVTLGSDQDFLAPIELLGLKKKLDLDKPINIKWKSIPNALGYVLHAFGGNEKATITWTSSARPDNVTAIDLRPVSRKELTQLLKKKRLLPPDATSCTIPAGIFKGSDSVMLTMTALGRDTIQRKDGIETQVIVRSTVSAPLYSTPWEIPSPAKGE